MNKKSLSLLGKGLMASFLLFTTAGICGALHAQSSAGVVQGTVVDPSQAAVPGAGIRLENRVSGHVSEATTGMDGTFRIPNVPFNPYHLTVTAPGFTSHEEDVDVLASVPLTVMTIHLAVGGTVENITVTGSATQLLEVTSEEHTDMDRNCSISCRSKALPRRLARWLRSLRRALPRTPMAFSTGSATTRKTRSPSMASRSRTNRARYSPTRFRRFDSIDGSDRRRAAGRIRRQDQRGDQRNDALGPGCSDASWQHHDFLRHLWHRQWWISTLLTAVRNGATSSPRMA